MKSLWKSAFKTKNNSNFAIKVAERSNNSFSVYLMNHLFKTSGVFQHVTMECLEINWLCKHRKKVKGSQASFPINPCTELGKTVFPVSIVKYETTKLKLANTLMHIWKSAILVFILKKVVEDFTLKHLSLFQICAREICGNVVYKHSNNNRIC